VLSLPPAVRIFLCTAPADLRKSFDGLAALVRQFLGADPLSGHLFVFRNKSGDRLKLLFWDRDGLVIYYKRLEEGTFVFPDGDGHGVEVRSADLAMLLDGVDLDSVRRRKRYRRSQPASA
jgi:transposase